MYTFTPHAKKLLTFARLDANRKKGLAVAGLADRAAVRELVDANRVQLRAEIDREDAFSGRIYAR